MAAIKIDNLYVTGSEFFADSESYLDELSASDSNNIIQGGSLKTSPQPTPPVYYTAPQPTPPVKLP